VFAVEGGGYFIRIHAGIIAFFCAVPTVNRRQKI
jgi:hypothetical protein